LKSREQSTTVLLHISFFQFNHAKCKLKFFIKYLFPRKSFVLLRIQRDSRRLQSVVFSSFIFFNFQDEKFSQVFQNKIKKILKILDLLKLLIFLKTFYETFFCCRKKQNGKLAKIERNKNFHFNIKYWINNWKKLDGGAWYFLQFFHFNWIFLSDFLFNY
jgi:hypothetical protein